VSILTDHVVSGSVSSAQVAKMTSATTVEGQSPVYAFLVGKDGQVNGEKLKSAIEAALKL